MKKFIALITCLVLVFSFVACGKTAPEEETTTAAAEEETTAATSDNKDNTPVTGDAVSTSILVIAAVAVVAFVASKKRVNA